MKLQVWSLSVCEGILAAAHGHFYRITEYYCPELGLCVNNEAYFLSKTDRYKTDEDTEFSNPAPEFIETIEISDEQAESLRVLANACREFNEVPNH
jgi:hypothetical protein